MSGCELGAAPEMNERNISVCEGEGRRKGREGGSAAASGLQAEPLLCEAGEEKAFFICEAEVEGV